MTKKGANQRNSNINSKGHKFKVRLIKKPFVSLNKGRFDGKGLWEQLNKDVNRQVYNKENFSLEMMRKAVDEYFKK